MSRGDTPADVQCLRAFVAAALGAICAFSLLRPVVDVPSARALLPELRAVMAIPCLAIRLWNGEL